MQNVFTLPLWGRWHDFGVTDEVVVYSGRQGSEAKPSPLSRQSRQLSRCGSVTERLWHYQCHSLPFCRFTTQSGSLLKPLTSGEVAPKVTERADPEVPEPAGETGGFCVAKGEGRVRVAFCNIFFGRSKPLYGRSKPLYGRSKPLPYLAVGKSRLQPCI